MTMEPDDEPRLNAYETEQTPISLGAASIPSDIILLVFEQLIGDGYTLSNVGLTCRAFRELSLPCLLRHVNVSSHNNGRVAMAEHSITPVVYADYGGRYRPDDLVPRQHAFLRLLFNRPELALHVQSFTWTLLWESVNREWTNEFVPNSIEHETWTVFGRMVNVTTLDLSSLHEVVDQPIARQNPSELFPGVTNLRLLGWMHRGLVQAIMTSLNPSRLERLHLDCLQDEGATPDGAPIGDEFTEAHAPQHGPENPVVICDEVYRRQQSGGAFIFPGPMWFALRVLSGCQLERLAHVKIELARVANTSDIRNYHTMFQETAALVLKVQHSLETLSISLGECPSYYDTTSATKLNVNQRHLRAITFRSDILMATHFLKQITLALCSGKFSRLAHIELEGFHLIEMADETEATSVQLQELRNSMQAARSNLVMDVDFTGKPHPDHRLLVFDGYSNGGWPEDDYSDALARS